MRVIPTAFLATRPVISSQILWMNWWGMTKTSKSASCTASFRFGTATYGNLFKGGRKGEMRKREERRHFSQCADFILFVEMLCFIIIMAVQFKDFKLAQIKTKHRLVLLFQKRLFCWLASTIGKCIQLELQKTYLHSKYFILPRS